MTWLVIHTKSSEEVRAEKNLKNQGFKTYLPMYKKEVVRGRSIKNTMSPLFPRYLFLEYNRSQPSADIGLIRSTLGVHQLLKIHEKPLEIKNKIIFDLKVRENMEKGDVESYYQKGDKIIIKAGPFKGIEAIFQCEDKEKRAVLLFDLINKPTLIHLDKSVIKKTN